MHDTRSVAETAKADSKKRILRSTSSNQGPLFLWQPTTDAVLSDLLVAAGLT